MERLLPAQSCLLVVDVQERLAAAMPKDALDRLVASACILLDAAEVLGVPVLATEQYPKGLGATLPPIAERLAKRNVAAIEKLDFDACASPEVTRTLGDRATRSVIVLGMETHVCVFQTARELVRRGYGAYVVADAVASRREENRLAGLALCERAGAIPTVTETVVFDWLARAGTPEFKLVSKLVK